jgi:preprotein translocase subunit SecD
MIAGMRIAGDTMAAHMRHTREHRMNIRAVTVASAASTLAAAVLSGCASHQTLEIRAASKDPVAGVVNSAPSKDSMPIYVLPQVVVTGADVAWARASTDERGGRAVSIWFTTDGARKFHEYTKAHVGQPVAVFVDGKLVEAPYVQSPLRDVATIGDPLHGGLSELQQRDLIAALNNGKTEPPQPAK